MGTVMRGAVIPSIRITWRAFDFYSTTSSVFLVAKGTCLYFWIEKITEEDGLNFAPLPLVSDHSMRDLARAERLTMDYVVEVNSYSNLSVREMCSGSCF